MSKSNGNVSSQSSNNVNNGTNVIKSNVAPLATEYGGDEVSAIVLDPGYSTVRTGFAGEDCPRYVIPTYYKVEGDSSSICFDENALYYAQPGYEVKNPMSTDGMVNDWDVASRLWEYSIFKLLGKTNQVKTIQSGRDEKPSQIDQDGDTEMTEAPASTEKQVKPIHESSDVDHIMSESPLIVTEPGWNTTKGREKMLEIAMEEWGVPAFWLGKTGALSAFSAGKATALVIDIGASFTSVTPVSDGMILKMGVCKSPLAGNFVSRQCRILFSLSQPPVPLMPHYLISAKKSVAAESPADAVYKSFAQPFTNSLRRFHEERVLLDFKESVVQVWEGPSGFPGVEADGSVKCDSGDATKSLVGRHFEMPDGWNKIFKGERYTVAEGLFDPKVSLCDDDNPCPRQDQSLPSLVENSLKGVDVDIRPNLLNNIVIVGGSSLLMGLTKRIDSEISALYPGPRTRIYASSNIAERKFSSWIGGSILASLGTFHQMWISRKEYDNHGAGIIEKRCK